MLVGAPVAYLERHGQQGIWSPRYYWLASCQQENIGAVSPHLLDRFALRLSWRSAENLAMSHLERVRVLQSNIQQKQPATLPRLDPTIMEHIKRAAQYPPLVKITSEACELIMAYQEGEIIHQRRELALARCALALAQLEDDAQLLESHVEQAAQLMGLQKKNRGEDTNAFPNRDDSEPPAPLNEEHRKSTATLPVQTSSNAQSEVVTKPIEAQTQESSTYQTIDYVIAATNPYPEDTEPILREAASLQVPQRRFVTSRSDRGPIIGVEPSMTFRDIALMSTLMRALLFQAFRPKNNPIKIVLDWTDLRKYRRAAEPERLLLLLLDYTSISLPQRQRALVPYLSQAYIERAGIAIIKVGAAISSAKSELRAECVSARNILVPIISEAIDASVGNATPLAHGLELALQVIYRALQHGRSTVQQVTFVVISDGRGNVPLQASHSNTITPPVAYTGIEDAQEQAQTIGEIKNVSSVVLSPQLRYYQDLPQQLANALNASFITLEDEEDEQA
jgi:magnesium chelatase subunit D